MSLAHDIHLAALSKLAALTNIGPYEKTAARRVMKLIGEGKLSRNAIERVVAGMTPGETRQVGKDMLGYGSEHAVFKGLTGGKGRSAIKVPWDDGRNGAEKTLTGGGKKERIPFNEDNLPTLEKVDIMDRDPAIFARSYPQAHNFDKAKRPYQLTLKDRGGHVQQYLKEIPKRLQNILYRRAYGVGSETKFTRREQMLLDMYDDFARIVVGRNPQSKMYPPEVRPSMINDLRFTLGNKYRMLDVVPRARHNIMLDPETMTFKISDPMFRRINDYEREGINALMDAQLVSPGLGAHSGKIKINGNRRMSLGELLGNGVTPAKEAIQRRAKKDPLYDLYYENW